MYNFGKKIVGIIIVVFLIFGTYTSAQQLTCKEQGLCDNDNDCNQLEECIRSSVVEICGTCQQKQCTTDQECIDIIGPNGKCTDGICTNIDEATVVTCSVKGAEKNSLGICKCPKGTKQIDKECVPCSDPGVCCGIGLNTKVPFIGNCIEFGKEDVPEDSENEISATQEEAFPKLMGGLMRILVTIIMLGSFIAILAGGVMISAAGPDEQRATKGKKLIIDVVIALAILGASGVILRLINPNFFG